MKKIAFTILTSMLCFFILNCENEADDPKPELAKWAGTWNAVDQYLDDSQLAQIWTNAANRVNTDFPGKNATAQNLKGLLGYMLKTDFKSCVISGDTIKIYSGPDATGTLSETIAYTYKGPIGEDGWASFEGNKEGQFKYLVMGPRHQDNPGSMEHFHFRYGNESIEAIADDPMWVATVTPTETTVTAIKEELEATLEEFPWEQVTADMLAPFN
jgi:Zn/Cd-binding protein ZinT